MRLTLAVSNANSMSVFAEAVASSQAQANAVGMLVSANGITGSASNSGDILATAFASATYASASAIGLNLASFGPIDAEVTNSGLISAFAETIGGISSQAQANGVMARGTSDTGNPFTFTNDGGAVFAGIAVATPNFRSVTPVSGEVIKRGTAFNFGSLTGPVSLDLTGNNPDGKGHLAGAAYLAPDTRQQIEALTSRYGYIFGNIVLNDDAGTKIDVSDGFTVFDGIINADGKRGSLNIFGDGTFVMVHNPEEGPSKANVANFRQYAGGVLALELTDDPDGDGVPQINADLADIDGDVLALFKAGLYGEETVFERRGRGQHAERRSRIPASPMRAATRRSSRSSPS